MVLIRFPVVTLIAAGLLGLIFVMLSVFVVRGRISGRIMLGSGEASIESSPLMVAVRTHANFAEYVPLCLLLTAGLEMRSGPTLLVKLLAAMLVLARLAHPFGMMRPSPNPFRALGFVGTLLVLAISSVAVLAAAL